MIDSDRDNDLRFIRNHYWLPRHHPDRWANAAIIAIVLVILALSASALN